MTAILMLNNFEVHIQQQSIKVHTYYHRRELRHSLWHIDRQIDKILRRQPQLPGSATIQQHSGQQGGTVGVTRRSLTALEAVLATAEGCPGAPGHWHDT